MGVEDEVPEVSVVSVSVWMTLFTIHNDSENSAAYSQNCNVFRSLAVMTLNYESAIN